MPSSSSLNRVKVRVQAFAIVGKVGLLQLALRSPKLTSEICMDGVDGASRVVGGRAHTVKRPSRSVFLKIHFGSTYMRIPWEYVLIMLHLGTHPGPTE